MPSLRAAALSVGVGTAVALYFALWFGWPTFLAVAIGATLTIIMLLFSASLADDPASADAAWRAAAPDLAARERAELLPPAGAGEAPAAEPARRDERPDEETP